MCSEFFFFDLKKKIVKVAEVYSHKGVREVKKTPPFISWFITIVDFITTIRLRLSIFGGKQENVTQV